MELFFVFCANTTHMYDNESAAFLGAYAESYMQYNKGIDIYRQDAEGNSSIFATVTANRSVI